MPPTSTPSARWRSWCARARLTTAVRIGVVSEEGPQEIGEQADATVDGPDGVRALLGALLGD